MSRGGVDSRCCYAMLFTLLRGLPHTSHGAHQVWHHPKPDCWRDTSDSSTPPMFVCRCRSRSASWPCTASTGASSATTAPTLWRTPRAARQHIHCPAVATMSRAAATPLCRSWHCVCRLATEWFDSCPNSSMCGKVMLRELETHIAICERASCPNASRGCPVCAHQYLCVGFMLAAHRHQVAH